MKTLNLYEFAAKKDTFHPVLKGIHYHNGFSEVSDSHILAVVKSDYDPSLEGEMIEKDGTEIVLGRYPNCDAVRPKRERTAGEC